MREYNVFKNFVEKHLAVFLPATYREARIEIFPVHKTNGLDYDGLTIRLGENGTAPLLPMKPYYQQLCDGDTIDEVMQQIAKDYLAMLQNATLDLEVPAFFELLCDQSWEKAKDHLGFHLLNPEKNEDRLRGKVYSKYLDLAKVYFLFLNRDGVIYSALIPQGLLEIWNVSMEELDRVATENMQKAFPREIAPLEPWPYVVIGEDPVLTIVTTEMYNFASAVLYDGVLEELRDMLNEDYYLIPSSTEEFLVCPKRNQDPGFLRTVLRDINREFVGEEIFLSDNLYEFTKESGKMQIVQIH